MPELLLELFSEEIPARMQARAAEDLARLVTAGLKGAGLTFGKVETFVTPRRLGLAVADIPAARPDLREEKRGPRVGAPAPALQGFLRSTGLASIDQCEQREVKGVRYYFAVVEQRGGDTAPALADIVLAAVRGLAWPKSMRWSATTFAYVRPLHNILALFDGQAVPGRLECGGGTVLEFTNRTFGHRFMAPGAIAIARAAEYRDALRDAFVVADRAERRERIRQEAKTLAAAHDLAVADDEALLDEVTGLVEWPVPLLGRIDAESMKLPREVLVTAMRSHQKYFALDTPEGAMAPHFLVVANMVTTDGGAAVVAGNERVLRARLADARFFWDTDRKVRLEERVKPLDAVTWHAKLGSIGEKLRRIEALAVEIAKHIPGADEAKVRRAAQLCKADLTTGMVGEFPELQGVMGRYYAIHDGENEDVANAIAEHWGPVGPSDTCPTAPVSVAVALADKIDSLVSFFAIDERPTGSRDPFALRRAALGIIRLILESNLRLPLTELMTASYARTAADFYSRYRFIVLDNLAGISSQVEREVELASLTTGYFGMGYVAAGATFQKLFEAGKSGRRLSLEERLEVNSEILEKINDLYAFTQDFLSEEHYENEGELREALLRREKALKGIHRYARGTAFGVFDFISDRLKFALRGRGTRHDLIDSVFALGGEDDLVRLLARVEALRGFIESEDGRNLLVAYRRAANIVKIEAKKDKRDSYGAPDAAHFTQAEERALAAALDTVARDSGALVAQEDFAGAMRLLAGLRAPVDAFFDKVTVNAPEKALRLNRLALLQRLAATMDEIADFSKIEG